MGYDACKDQTTTNNNTGVGYKSLENQTGTKNTGLGAYTLGSGTTGGSNTALGYAALYQNTADTMARLDFENCDRKVFRYTPEGDFFLSK